MIENLDDNDGALMQTLEREQLREKTGIVFISNHGEMMGSHGLLDQQHPYAE